jgi:hypothetical protein
MNSFRDPAAFPDEVEFFYGRAVARKPRANRGFDQIKEIIS